MKTRSKIFLIGLGGSIINPVIGEIDTEFLKKFKALIDKFIKKGNRFVFITGGGKVARLYQSAAKEIVNASSEDQDWLGIKATKINAELLRVVFAKNNASVLDEPSAPVKSNWKVLIGSGFKPGRSTDYMKVLLAKRFGIKEIIDAGNIAYVYDKDLHKYKDAKPIEKLSYKEYQNIIGKEWTPGLSAPFDPVATRLAEKYKLKIIVLLGTNLENLEKVLKGEKYKGTIIGKQ